MSRHSSSSTATARSGTESWNGEGRREKKEEYEYDREQQRREDRSRTHSHTSPSRKRGDHGEDRKRAEAHDDYENRKSRHEKKSAYPDKESRLLAFVHDVDGVAERLVRRAEYGESGAGRKREIRRVVKELEVVYKGGAGGGRHGR